MGVRNEILDSTLEAFEKGYYHVSGKKIEIMLDKGKYKSAVTYLPYDVYKNMEKYAEFKKKGTKCNVSVSSQDSLEAAKEMLDSTVGGRIAVLNFANPLSPGGGVRRGAKAQEETLCLRSSLLKSLESMDANKYYEYNHEHRTFAGSDAIILSEDVEVIKDSNYKFLEKGFLVSVISCAAPMVSPFTHRLEDTTDEQMEVLLYRRIVGVLTTLICHNYRNVILGAWGCGAFSNNPVIIAKLFKRAFEEIGVDEYFDNIHFAILAQKDTYNFDVFKSILLQ